MAARERRETRLAILAATVIVGTVIFVCRNKDGGIEVDTAKYYLKFFIMCKLEGTTSAWIGNGVLDCSWRVFPCCVNSTGLM